VDLLEIAREGMDWIYWAQNRGQWRAVLNSATENLLSIKGTEFLAPLSNYKFLNMDFDHGLSYLAISPKRSLPLRFSAKILHALSFPPCVLHIMSITSHLILSPF
jgi:hypothetical protein